MKIFIWFRFSVWCGFHFTKIICKPKIEYFIRFSSILANSIRLQIQLDIFRFDSISCFDFQFLRIKPEFYTPSFNSIIYHAHLPSWTPRLEQQQAVNTSCLFGPKVPGCFTCFLDSHAPSHKHYIVQGIS